jgi:glycosyltransferase involved in cell wall biosynthesis
MQFSIIIPSKNEEANIGRCLDSIGQVHWDKDQYEIIVVDNGSTDRTVEIARQKGAAVYVKPELTISGLRNFGARQAAAEILVFIDADCTVDYRWLCEAVRYLPRQDVVCFGSPPIVPENASWVQKAWFEVRRKSVTVGETDWLESMNMFVRRYAFAECGGFDEALVTCEDYDLSYRLKKIGFLLNDNRVAAVHHGEAATAAHFFRKEMWRGVSNFRGLLRHGVILREIPSLVAPSVHCLLLVAVASGPLLYRTAAYRAVLVVFLLWQSVLFLLSFRKNRQISSPIRVVQLYCLLNVYFLARGLAVFRGR